MASYLQIENISKSYGPKILFHNIGFNINEGDKIALIAPNGTGKTSLLKILAGKDKSDEGGEIKFLKDIRIAFLEQEYSFAPQNSILDQIMSGSTAFTQHLDQEHYFKYELKVQQILTSFGLNDYTKQMSTLSGGEIKRVALTQMLATEADFFIMDEPTNHLDIDAIEFLESYLSHSRSTLLMVTHDRYFLDRVCNTIIEMDNGAVYTYKGNYENYLEKREERIENYNAQTDKVRNILRRELEWIRSTPCARSGKAKYRIDAFYELKDRAEAVYKQGTVNMNSIGTGARLGSKIINCKNVNFYYSNKCMLKDFTYNFQRYERVGIVGKNGVGKSTFINILTGNINNNGVLSGEIERGESLNIGYYHQSGMQFNEEQTVIETINDTHLLSQFMFSHDMLNNKIARLSGGERRRLYLLTILAKQPNLLILDEPTNDLDIVTLNILEEYLKSYKGSLIIISHDRHFLDRLVDHLLVFCGDGIVKDFIGLYSEYRQYIKDISTSKSTNYNNTTVKERNWRDKSKDDRKKLSYKEKKELEELSKEIDILSRQKQELGLKMSNGDVDFDKIQQYSNEYAKITEQLDAKELRWLELSEIDGYE